MKISSNYSSTSIERFGSNVSSGIAKQRSQETGGAESDLITSGERNFFKKLFPENSDQIDKHIVFNRNGKTSQFNFAKGSIVDGIA